MLAKRENSVHEHTEDGLAANQPHKFIKMLVDLIELQSRQEKLMSWNEESNGFIVTNVKKLERDILPVYFKHNNLDSFTRQLNTYGFRKIRSKASVEFKHELFVKDRLDLINSIRRRPSERIMP